MDAKLAPYAASVPFRSQGLRPSHGRAPRRRSPHRRQQYPGSPSSRPRRSRMLNWRLTRFFPFLLAAVLRPPQGIRGRRFVGAVLPGSAAD